MMLILFYIGSIMIRSLRDSSILKRNVKQIKTQLITYYNILETKNSYNMDY